MAMNILQFNQINWFSLCQNPADWAVDLLLANMDKLEKYFMLVQASNQYQQTYYSNI